MFTTRLVQAGKTVWWLWKPITGAEFNFHFQVIKREINQNFLWSIYKNHHIELYQIIKLEFEIIKLTVFKCFVQIIYNIY